jgi:hypothetical protein
MKRLLVALAVVMAATGADAKSRKHVKNAEATGATHNPNGEWRIESATTVGSCDGLIPTELSVVDGKIANASGASVTSWGYVDDAGQIVARFTGSGDRVARFHGQLRGSQGSGAWSSSTDMCGGTWRATRG